MLHILDNKYYTDDELKWFNIVYTSRTDSNTFVSNGVDYTKYRGYGVRVTDGSSVISYHIIDAVTFSTNSTIDVVGEPLPTTISTIELCSTLHIIGGSMGIERGIDPVSMQAVSDDVLNDGDSTTENAINTPVRLYENCKFIYMETDFPDGQGTNPTVNCRKNDGASNILSSNITINASTNDSGVTTQAAQRDFVKGDRISFRLVSASDNTIKSGMVRYWFIKGD